MLCWSAIPIVFKALQPFETLQTVTPGTQRNALEDKNFQELICVSHVW